MTGRRLHDALLRALTSAELRRGLEAPEADDRLAVILGAEEAEVLRRADGERLRRLARFLGRHFYRERIVRLFAASRALARARGSDPLELLATPAFDALLESAEVGSAATAEQVAVVVEGWILETLGGLPFTADLVQYEGALFRAEAGPRRWGDGGGPTEGIPVRAVGTRVVSLDWDVIALVTAVRCGEIPLPVPTRAATRLLVALSADGRVSTLRCPEAVLRLLDALDGTRSAEAVARELGLSESEAGPALRQLAAVGAVTWGATSSRASLRSSGSTP